MSKSKQDDKEALSSNNDGRKTPPPTYYCNPVCDPELVELVENGASFPAKASGNDVVKLPSDPSKSSHKPLRHDNPLYESSPESMSGEPSVKASDIHLCYPPSDGLLDNQEFYNHGITYGRYKKHRNFIFTGAIFLTLLLVIATLAVGIYFGVLSQQHMSAQAVVHGGSDVAVSSSVQTTPHTTPKHVAALQGAEFKGTLRLRDVPWDGNLTNSSTYQYQQFSVQLQNQLDAVFQAGNLKAIYNHSEVIGFRSGSLLVDYILYFNPFAATTGSNEGIPTTVKPPAGNGTGSFLTDVTSINASTIAQVLKDSFQAITLANRTVHVDAASITVYKVQPVTTQSVSSTVGRDLPSTSTYQHVSDTSVISTETSPTHMTAQIQHSSTSSTENPLVSFSGSSLTIPVLSKTTTAATGGQTTVASAGNQTSMHTIVLPISETTTTTEKATPTMISEKAMATTVIRTATTTSAIGESTPTPFIGESTQISLIGKASSKPNILNASSTRVFGKFKSTQVFRKNTHTATRGTSTPTLANRESTPPSVVGNGMSRPTPVIGKDTSTMTSNVSTLAMVIEKTTSVVRETSTHAIIGVHAIPTTYSESEIAKISNQSVTGTTISAVTTRGVLGENTNHTAVHENVTSTTITVTQKTAIVSENSRHTTVGITGNIKSTSIKIIEKHTLKAVTEKVSPTMAIEKVISTIAREKTTHTTANEEFRSATVTRDQTMPANKSISVSGHGTRQCPNTDVIIHLATEACDRSLAVVNNSDLKLPQRCVAFEDSALCTIYTVQLSKYNCSVTQVLNKLVTAISHINQYFPTLNLSDCLTALTEDFTTITLRNRTAIGAVPVCEDENIYYYLGTYHCSQYQDQLMSTNKSRSDICSSIHSYMLCILGTLNSIPGVMCSEKPGLNILDMSLPASLTAQLGHKPSGCLGNGSSESDVCITLFSLPPSLFNNCSSFLIAVNLTTNESNRCFYLSDYFSCVRYGAESLGMRCEIQSLLSSVKIWMEHHSQEVAHIEACEAIVLSNHNKHDPCLDAEEISLSSVHHCGMLMAKLQYFDYTKCSILFELMNCIQIHSPVVTHLNCSSHLVEKTMFKQWKRYGIDLDHCNKSIPVADHGTQQCQNTDVIIHLSTEACDRSLALVNNSDLNLSQRCVAFEDSALCTIYAVQLNKYNCSVIQVLNKLVTAINHINQYFPTLNLSNCLTALTEDYTTIMLRNKTVIGVAPVCEDENIFYYLGTYHCNQYQMELMSANKSRSHICSYIHSYMLCILGNLNSIPGVMCSEKPVLKILDMSLPASLTTQLGHKPSGCLGNASSEPDVCMNLLSLPPSLFNNCSSFLIAVNLTTTESNRCFYISDYFSCVRHGAESLGMRCEIHSLLSSVKIWMEHDFQDVAHIEACEAIVLSNHSKHDPCLDAEEISLSSVHHCGMLMAKLPYFDYTKCSILFELMKCIQIHSPVVTHLNCSSHLVEKTMFKQWKRYGIDLDHCNKSISVADHRTRQCPNTDVIIHLATEACDRSLALVNKSDLKLSQRCVAFEDSALCTIYAVQLNKYNCSVAQVLNKLVTAINHINQYFPTLNLSNCLSALTEDYTTIMLRNKTVIGATPVCEDENIFYYLGTYHCSQYKIELMSANKSHSHICSYIHSYMLCILGSLNSIPGVKCSAKTVLKILDMSSTASLTTQLGHKPSVCLDKAISVADHGTQQCPNTYVIMHMATEACGRSLALVNDSDLKLSQRCFAFQDAALCTIYVVQLNKYNCSVIQVLNKLVTAINHINQYFPTLNLYNCLSALTEDYTTIMLHNKTVIGAAPVCEDENIFYYLGTYHCNQYQNEIMSANKSHSDTCRSIHNFVECIVTAVRSLFNESCPEDIIVYTLDRQFPDALRGKLGHKAHDCLGIPHLPHTSLSYNIRVETSTQIPRPSVHVESLLHFNTFQPSTKIPSASIKPFEPLVHRTPQTSTEFAVSITHEPSVEGTLGHATQMASAMITFEPIQGTLQSSRELVVTVPVESVIQDTFKQPSMFISRGIAIETSIRGPHRMISQMPSWRLSLEPSLSETLHPATQMIASSLAFELSIEPSIQHTLQPVTQFILGNITTEPSIQGTPSTGLAVTVIVEPSVEGTLHPYTHMPSSIRMLTPFIHGTFRPSATLISDSKAVKTSIQATHRFSTQSISLEPSIQHTLRLPFQITPDSITLESVVQNTIDLLAQTVSASRTLEVDSLIQDMLHPSTQLTSGGSISLEPSLQDTLQPSVHTASTSETSHTINQGTFQSSTQILSVVTFMPLSMSSLVATTAELPTHSPSPIHATSVRETTGSSSLSPSG